MRLRILLPIALMAAPAFPALSQETGGDALSAIISSSEGDRKPENTATRGLAGALDFISVPAGNTDNAPTPAANAATSASALDFVASATVDQDPLTSLVGLFSPQGKNNPEIGVLDLISGTYNDTGFYVSGVFDTMDFNKYGSGKSAIAPMSGMTFYSPEWGKITSGFGYRPQFKRMHKGIDISMNIGDTVRVALPGIVEKVAYDDKGYGHYIIVRHEDGMETRYAHLSATIAAAGQKVMAGQPIALSGNTGNSTGPHLHFETRYNGQPVDPQTVFNFGGNRNAAYFDNQDSSPAPASTAMATGFNGSKKSLIGKSTYVVREGDTLSKIAKRANISVLRICQLNFMTESQILMPGTMLKLK